MPVTHEPTGRGLGWRPDIPDFRDFKFGASPHAAVEMAKPIPPRFVIHNWKNQRIKDQRQIGSCTGQAWSRRAQTERRLSEQSALAIYYEERRINGETGEDSGAYIRDGAKVVSNYGVPRENLWPDNDDNVFKDPVDKVDRDAARKKFAEYLRIGASRDEMLACLASGHGFVMGISCYDSMFEPFAEQTGIISVPKESESLQGGHALDYGGYDLDFKNSEQAQRFRQMGYSVDLIPSAVLIFANSWTKDWGDEGYGYLDLNYAANPDLADDRWTIRVK